MPHDADPERDWRWVLTGYLAAAVTTRVADEGARVSLVLLSLDVAGSAKLGGLLVAVLLAPHVIAAPLVGLAIDRGRRPRWILVLGILVFAASLLAVALVLGRAPVWLTVVLLLLGGCAGPTITGGLTSQLPNLVGIQRAPRAFGFDSLLYNVASMAGPALAGITAAVISPRAAQTLLAGSAALGAALVAALPIASAPPHAVPSSAMAQDKSLTDAPAGEPDRPTLLSGAKEILQQPTLRVVTMTSTLGQLGPGALAVVAALLGVSWHRPASSGLLLTAVAAGSFLGSLLWTWRPVAAHRPALVMAASMIGIGLPLAFTAVAPSVRITGPLFALSGFFIGPFGSALFTARTRYSRESVRTQVFTIGAGLKVAASALGAALIGLVDGLPIPVLLLLVAASPLLAGILGTALLTHGQSKERHQEAPAEYWSRQPN